MIYAAEQCGELHTALLFEHLGEVPKLAEGTPLERVQVVNSGARVQIPPSPRKENPGIMTFRGFSCSEKTC